MNYEQYLGIRKYELEGLKMLQDAIFGKRRTYLLYIKSHSEAPDYEDEVEALSLDEAVNHFFNKLARYGYDKEIIKDNMAYVDERGEVKSIKD